MTAVFFDRSTSDGAEWFVPTQFCRGPWDDASCHAGPPTGLVARAAEALNPDKRLVRLTVELLRPIPMAGFRVDAEIVKRGAQVTRSSVSLVDTDGRTCANASALHIVPLDERELPTAPARFPGGRLGESTDGLFPIQQTLHGLPAIISRESMQTRYPQGETSAPGPTTIWMKTIPLLADEPTSPFQRICVLADSGNAIGRNSEPDRYSFVNPDLTVVLHREPVGEWLGSQAVSDWQPDGIGLADALLFDQHGVVGRALQTLLIR